MSDRPRGLGKGLGALIPSAPRTSPDPDRPVDLLFAEGRRFTGNHTPRAPMPDVFRRPGSAPYPESTTAAPGTSPELTAPDRAAGLRIVAEAAPAPQPGSTVQLEDGLAEVPGAAFAHIPLEAVQPNPRQPRTVFDEDALTELTESVQLVGVLQPIVVRRSGDGYELVMGERRLRAAKAAGLEAIPAIVRDTGDDVLLRDALLENLHRADLNPLEEAAAYQQLLDDFGCTHDELATRLGRSRPQISNTLRLLKLPPLVQRRVAACVLSAGHARALLGLPDAGAMERLAQRIVAEGLSVRTTEEAVTLGQVTEDEASPRRRPGTDPGPHAERLDAVAATLSNRLETTVKVSMGRKKGRVTVDFADLDDLDRILTSLG